MKQDDIDDLPMLGFDWRDAMKVLECTRPELDRWVSEGRLPYDGRVRTYRFSSMSHSYSTIEGGWRPETIVAAKAHIEEWRVEYKTIRKQQQRQKTNARKTKPNVGTIDILDAVESTGTI